MENNNLEQFFNKKFNEPIVPDDWNTPSDQVWDLINADLDKENRKNRLIPFLPWIVALVALGALVWFALNLINTKTELTSALNKVEIVNQKNIILSEQLKLKNSEIDAKTIELSTLAKAKAPSAYNYKKYHPVYQSNNQKNDLLTNIKTSNTTEKGAILATTELPSLGSIQKSESNTQELVSSLIEIQQLAFNFDPVVSISKDKLTISSPSFSSEKLNTVTPSTFTLGASSTYSHWNDKYIIMNSQNINESLLNEKINNNFSHGLELNSQLAKHWELQLGLRYGKRTHATSFDLNVPYDMSTEVLDAEGVIHSTFNHLLPSGYGNVDTEIVLLRSSGSPVSHTENINLNLTFDNQITYLHLPLAARYYFRNNQNGWFIGAGLQTEFIINQDIISNQLVSHHSHVHEGSVNTSLAAKQTKKANFSAMMQLGYKIKLNNTWDIMSAVQYNSGISTVYESSEYKHYVNFFGLSIGVNRKF